MTTFFPLTGVIARDADTMIQAINKRSAQVKSMQDSQTLVKRVTLASIKILSLASAVVATASIPAAIAVSFTVPLTIGITSIITAIACLSLSLYLEPRSSGELIVKDLWKKVFEALREGNGKKMVETARQLAAQQEKRTSAFTKCLGETDPAEATPFLHKICFVGYLQQALYLLEAGEPEQAKTTAKLAISHYASSGFSPAVGEFAASIIKQPQTIKSLVEGCNTCIDLHRIDSLIEKWSSF